MTTYQNILVAVDGSEEAEQALERAIHIAADNHARLVIAHVIDNRNLVQLAQYDSSITERAKAYGQELLDGYIETAKQSGVDNVTTALEFGSPRAEISKTLAKRFEADLIVVGATGLNAVERLLIGSVSEAIIRQAACDVLVVRKR
ncbi:universal stress protein [Bacillus thermotolerans]|uniref:Universal stress protein n=1 Tax=Bacillus thermotolerans TaxID=1221996 RepID=A0A0F5HM29_BACTR|nr:universal stress protein [Bacillus thermotolerans]KKB33290.1 Universal stress protein family [Bacillus thermotolerans]KKB34346.1 Universal stress protein family [Bacillus thermotolerans]KKB41108.1 Universal stress protein family [Bacillus thermotolerans]